MSKNKILKRGKKKQKTRKLVLNASPASSTKGMLKKQKNQTWANAAVKAGKAPDKATRKIIKAKVQGELKSIMAHKQKQQKPLSNKSNIKKQQKPSRFKKAIKAIGKTVSNTIRKNRANGKERHQ